MLRRFALAAARHTANVRAHPSRRREIRHVKISKRGPFKGKTVEFASSERIEEFQRIADDFMLEIFDFVPGEYLITDESSLRDFTHMGTSDTSSIWSLINKIYAIERSDAASEKLVDIFAAIQARRSVQ